MAQAAFGGGDDIGGGSGELGLGKLHIADGAELVGDFFDGLMDDGFSAGAELVAASSLFYVDFDARNDVAGNPLAKISSRPDFAGLVYPGPSPFFNGGTAEIPRDAPPSFIACTANPPV